MEGAELTCQKDVRANPFGDKPDRLVARINLAISTFEITRRTTCWASAFTTDPHLHKISIAGRGMVRTGAVDIVVVSNGFRVGELSLKFIAI